MPVKSASIRVASAVPTLPKVPRHPRGELNSPWVLICVGGLFPGERAVDRGSLVHAMKDVEEQRLDQRRIRALRSGDVNHKARSRIVSATL